MPRLFWGQHRWDACTHMCTRVSRLVTCGSGGSWSLGVCVSLWARVPPYKVWVPLPVPPGAGGSEGAVKQLWGQEEACWGSCAAGGEARGWARGRGPACSVCPTRGSPQPSCVGSLCLSQDPGASMTRRASEVPGQEGENQTELAAPGQPRGPETAAWQPRATWRPWRGSWTGCFL